jgi:hypothetical protein
MAHNAGTGLLFGPRCPSSSSSQQLLPLLLRILRFRTAATDPIDAT